MKRLLQAAGAAFVLGTAGCSKEEPSVEECRIVVNHADSKSKAEAEASAKHLAKERAATEAKAAAAAKVITQDESAPKAKTEEEKKTEHDSRMHSFHVFFETGRKGMDNIGMSLLLSIQKEITQGNDSYTPEEQEKFTHAVKKVIKDHPGIALQNIATPFDYEQHKTLFGIDVTEEVLKNFP